MPRAGNPKPKRAPPLDDLGPVTAKWDYFDAHGRLLAVVYRYDPPGRGKEFRPWDVLRRKAAPPEPRPLYNQPGLAGAARVVLVEGEKCAQALIDVGVAATTAMHGANAPVDKTDWSPLAGKVVLVWPDRDKPGWEYAVSSAQALLAAGATTCHVLYPPEDAATGWDAADALAEGFDVSRFLEHGPRLQIHACGDEPDSPISTDESIWGSQDALALAFTRRYHPDWRYVAAWSRWMVWDGHRWRGEDTLAATDVIRGVCRQTALQADNPKLAARLIASGTVSGVEWLARCDRRHAATVGEWDTDPWLLNTPGGVIDLKTGHQRPNERADRLTKVTTALRGAPTCPTWRQFLAEVTGGDVPLQAYLQRMAGYTLTGSTQEHAMFFLYGTGSNGKSVFVHTLATLLGDYAVNAPMDTFMETRGDRHPTELAGLRGARFVAAIETEQGRRWNEAKVKNLTGGDKIAARFMRQDFFEFQPQFKLVIAGNHKPALRNVDEAMKRRLHLIPFTVTIPTERRDPQLAAKLLAERDAILAWAIEGCLAWQRDGLNPPRCVVSATEEYFDEEDALGEFLDQQTQRFSQARVAVADIFKRWQEWAAQRGEYVGTSRWLAQQLANRGFDRARLHGGVKAFAGLSLRPKDNDSRLPYRDD